ncbi:MAG: acyl-CoA thioesterase [Bacteroidota bacterium]
MEYHKTFEIRWSDLDPNRHLANSSYQNFMSHTRMSFLIENGFSQSALSKLNLGPVVFHEHIHYFKELLPEDRVIVSLELSGISKDGMFFEFVHNLYNQKGKHCAQCEMFGAWIDLSTRKLTKLPDELTQRLLALNKSDNFRYLTKADSRKHQVVPKNIEL